LQLVLVLGLFAACGGDEPTRDDAETMRAIFASSAEVERAVRPLMFCLPENPECYRRAGPAIVPVAEGARKVVDDLIADTDDACLREVAGLYRDSLDEAADAGRAAAVADTEAVDTALSEVSRLQLAYATKVGECGLAEGRMAEYAAAIREVDLRMIRLDEEFAKCRGAACLEGVARYKAAAKDGVVAVDRLLERLAQDDEAPGCFQTVFQEKRNAYRALAEALEAAEAGDVATFKRKATIASELEAAGYEDMAACIGSAGS
jgi:hypothetical protein